MVAGYFLGSTGWRGEEVRLPKILCFDIESCGVNALRADLGFVVVFGWKWVGEKKAHSITISKERLKKFDDSQLLREAHLLMEEADLLVGHYASVFDRRFLQGRLLINKLAPIPATKIRDTCMIARSVANFSSNRLKHLANILDLRHKKLENGWPKSWFKVMTGDMVALKAMAHYCEGDVLALEELYMRLRPFDNNHPRLHDGKLECPVDKGRVIYRGFAYVNDKKYRRYVCTSCGKWGRERSAAK